MANELNVEDGEYSEPVSPTAPVSQQLSALRLHSCCFGLRNSCR
ncbi:hypothetical protein Gotur_021899 [Gossypium turneri]